MIPTYRKPECKINDDGSITMFLPKVMNKEECMRYAEILGAKTSYLTVGGQYAIVIKHHEKNS